MFSSLYCFEPTLFISCHKNLVNTFIIITFHTLSYYTHCCNTNKKWKQYKTLLPTSDGADLLSGKRSPLTPAFLEPYAYTTRYCSTEEWKPTHIFSPLYIRNSTQSHSCCLNGWTPKQTQHPSKEQQGTLSLVARGWAGSHCSLS